MDESTLDADQVENLIKFCPTKEEMELLKVKRWINGIPFHVIVVIQECVDILLAINLNVNIKCLIMNVVQWQGYNGDKENLGKCEQVCKIFSWTRFVIGLFLVKCNLESSAIVALDLF